MCFIQTVISECLLCSSKEYTLCLSNTEEQCAAGWDSAWLFSSAKTTFFCNVIFIYAGLLFNIAASVDRKWFLVYNKSFISWIWQRQVSGKMQEGAEGEISLVHEKMLSQYALRYAAMNCYIISLKNNTCFLKFHNDIGWLYCLTKTQCIETAVASGN